MKTGKVSSAEVRFHIHYFEKKEMRVEVVIDIRSNRARARFPLFLFNWGRLTNDSCSFLCSTAFHVKMLVNVYKDVLRIFYNTIDIGFYYTFFFYCLASFPRWKQKKKTTNSDNKGCFFFFKQQQRKLAKEKLV
jgi:hypothetical protein